MFFFYWPLGAANIYCLDINDYNFITVYKWQAYRGYKHSDIFQIFNKLYGVDVMCVVVFISFIICFLL